MVQPRRRRWPGRSTGASRDCGAEARQREAEAEPGGARWVKWPARSQPPRRCPGPSGDAGAQLPPLLRARTSVDLAARRRQSRSAARVHAHIGAQRVRLGPVWTGCPFAPLRSWTVPPVLDRGQPPFDVAAHRPARPPQGTGGGALRTWPRTKKPAIHAGPGKQGGPTAQRRAQGGNHRASSSTHRPAGRRHRYRLTSPAQAEQAGCLARVASFSVISARARPINRVPAWSVIARPPDQEAVGRCRCGQCRRAVGCRRGRCRRTVTGGRGGGEHMEPGPG